MAGAQFEYDESGATAYYFFMSFLAMILIPMTYVLWPISRRKGKAPISDLREIT